MARVLVVDDDRAVRGAIETLLTHAGYTVVARDSGREAIAEISASTFDVAIVDLFMPGMDGLETIKALHARAPFTPIVAMSGFGFRDAPGTGPDFLGMAAKLGAARSLQKPFRPRELLAAVEACLAGTDRPAAAETPSASA